jgi:hypothetical protein
VYSREPQGNATCYDSLSIVTAGAYWMTWWSTTICHIQRVMIQMIPHGHGMHSILLIKFFHLALKSSFN